MAEVIDAHHHLWHYSPEEYGWITEEMGVLRRDFLAADLEKEMHAAGVSGAIVVQARQSLEETRWLLEVAAENKSIRGVVGWLPLRSANLASIVQEFRDCSLLKGVRHVIQDEPDDDFVLREDFNAGVAALAETGLVYEILIHERHLSRAIEFVKRHPRQVFVLDHLAKPLVREGIVQPWRDHLLRLAECGNVFCKLSGLVTEADWAAWTPDLVRPYMDTALEAFGAERLMAGSDWPVCLLASGYERWWGTLREWLRGVSAEDSARILGENAKRVYGL